MNGYKHIQETLQKEYSGAKEAGIDYKKIMRDKLFQFRNQEESITKVDKPSNIPRARSLGYKAKNGVVVVRAKVRKGSGKMPRPRAARRPKRMGTKKRTRGKSIQRIAEERAARKYPNCEVLNSYFVGQDGKCKYFEIILIDRDNPEMRADKDLSWICDKRGRAFRGLTSAGKKGRGLMYKGKGTEQVRPSVNASHGHSK
ncbi:MAG: 50S ribosomal protein L15e [archaeon]